jgi:hypothetical protein
MLNDFLPAIISISILSGAILFVWISDVRRIRHLNVPERVQTKVHSMIERESREPALDVDAIGQKHTCRSNEVWRK